MDEQAGGWEAAARAAGWLAPDEAEFKVWCARNLNGGDKCRWCGAFRAWGTHGSSWWKRSEDPQPHRAHCKFYDGPVEHRYKSGHLGTFDFWINCTCGKSYPQHDTDGNEQECPDRELAWRHPRSPDLLAPILAAGPGQDSRESRHAAQNPAVSAGAPASGE